MGTGINKCTSNIVRKIVNLPSFEQAPDAVAIDLDGTLLNSQTQLSERNHAAVERCIRQDIPQW